MAINNSRLIYRRTRINWTEVFFAFFTISLATFFGLVISIGSPKLSIFLVSAFLGGFALILSVPVLVIITLLTAFVISGTGIYFMGMKQLLWLPYSLMLMTGVRLLLDSVSKSEKTSVKLSSPAFVWAIFLFLLSVFISSLVNGVDLGFVLIAQKNYVVIWVLVFACWLSSFDEKIFNLIWRMLLVIACIQFPVAIIQRIFYAGSTFGAQALNWDAVVGTFGGDPEGGGMSGAMVLFQVVIIAYMFMLFRRKAISGVYAAIVLICCFGTIALAEVKAFFIIFPLAMLFVFADNIRKKPAHFVAGSLLVFAVVGVVLFGYYRMYVNKDVHDRGFVDTLAPRFSYIFESKGIDYRTGEVARIPSIIIWSDANLGKDLFGTTFGHGPMAARVSSTFGPGDVIKKYSINIAMYTVPAYLWELGVFGFSSFLFVLVTGYLYARKLAKSTVISPQLIDLANTSALAVLLVAIFLPYNRDMIDSAAIQTLLAISLGQVAWIGRRIDELKINHINK